jgi:hypothetical protein
MKTMETRAIPRRLAFTAGGQQLINWGISFYMPGTFAGLSPPTKDGPCRRSISA